MNNIELIKIEKPAIGWSWNKLEEYNLTPWINQSLKSHYKIVLKILNEYLTYFYIPKNNSIMYLIINDDIYQSLEEDARQQYKIYFTKNILTYASFSTRKIIKYSDWLTLTSEVVQPISKTKTETNIKHKVPIYEYYQKQINCEYEPHKIECKYEYKINNSEAYGIYGIYTIDENNQQILLYIGMTLRTFLQRWQEHMDIITLNQPPSPGMIQTYEILRQYNTKQPLLFIPLISNQKIMTDTSKLSRRDWESMELALIHTLQPLCNKQGLYGPYIYSNI